jgi:hypothetical protein
MALNEVMNISYMADIQLNSYEWELGSKLAITMLFIVYF